MSPVLPQQKIEWVAEHLARPDFDRYIDACDTFGIIPVKWSVWWERYGDDYRAQIQIAAPSTPVAEQLVEEAAGTAHAGGLLGTIAVGGVGPAPDTSSAPSASNSVPVQTVSADGAECESCGERSQNGTLYPTTGVFLCEDCQAGLL